MRYGYARGSTAAQDGAMQIDALRAAACDQVVVENGSGSGPLPKLDALLDQLRPGDELCVWKLDRLGRSLKKFIEASERVKNSGAQLRSLTEPVDTRSAFGEAMFQILGVFAQLEAAWTLERTSAGRRSAEAQGRKGGRPPKLNTEKRAHVREMLAAGKSVGETARILGVGRATIYRAVKG
jgi:DNA invertase Pin-like site-specific DNA recombinase